MEPDRGDDEDENIIVVPDEGENRDNEDDAWGDENIDNNNNNALDPNPVIVEEEKEELNGDLDEIIYMECPDGIVCEADEVVRLNKSMYGLVQASRQFFLKSKSILISAGFTQCKAEPCLFFKTVNGVMIIMAIHVDDCYVIGKTNTINQAVKDIESKGLS
jgi:Reverse transcriptase (RNA-dependent DNA polymerase)